MLKPSLRVANLSIARVPPKTAAACYLSVDWKTLRIKVFERDHWHCVIPGCGQPAKVCEHIVSRRGGGSDDMSNLCSLCRDHDNHFKEDASGARRNAEEWHQIFGIGRSVPPRPKVLSLVSYRQPDLITRGDFFSAPKV
jgi:hypothetical protein